MSYYQTNSFVFFLLFALNIVSLSANEPLHSQEVALYSSRTGKLITTISYSVEVNTSESPENYILRIENKADASEEKLLLWIFGRKIDAQEFASRNSPIEVDDIRLFDSFCHSSEVKFTIPNIRKIEKQSLIPFDVNAQLGSKIEMTCNLYIASHKKKKTIINDEAKLKIEFILPKQIVRDDDGNIITLEVDKSLGPTVPLTPEEVEEKRLAQEDSIQQVKMKQLHTFISKANEDIVIINTSIDSLLQNKIYEKSQIDSIENSVNALKKKVDFHEMGSVALLAYDESLMNSFADFSSKHTDTTRKIEELKAGPEKRNWLMIFAIGAMVMFAGTFIFQIWNQIKSKRQQLKTKKELLKINKQTELDSLDDNELGKI